MSHITREKVKLLARVRRIRGQVDALERAIDADKECAEVLHQVAGVRGAMQGLMTEVLEGHIREHVASPSRPAVRSRGADELIDVLRSYLR